MNCPPNCIFVYIVIFARNYLLFPLYEKWERRPILSACLDIVFSIIYSWYMKIFEERKGRSLFSWNISHCSFITTINHGYLIKLYMCIFNIYSWLFIWKIFKAHFPVITLTHLCLQFLDYFIIVTLSRHSWCPFRAKFIHNIQKRYRLPKSPPIKNAYLGTGRYLGIIKVFVSNHWPFRPSYMSILLITAHVPF